MPKHILFKNATRILIILGLLPMLFPAMGAMTLGDDLLKQLRLDYAALASAEDDYRSLREGQSLEGQEASDYAAYVAKLQRRVFEDCYEVLRSGVTLPDDLPCPVIVTPVSQSADIDTETEQTRQEQIAALDATLNQGLGEFDERLLQEQERIKAASPSSNSGSGGGGGGASGNGSGATGGGSQNGGDQAGAGSSQTGEGSASGEQTEKGENGGGMSGAGGGQQDPGSGGPGDSGGAPPDIPDGSDDDVVARQLREAAEKETDPELKAKLWEEYRKYKQGTH